MERLIKVPAAAPVAPWLGGKKALHRKILVRIDCIPHDTYVEPFVGMGGVFLRRQWRPKCEVANDLSGDVHNLFRILQRHHHLLIEVMKFQITSRREFERLRKCDPKTLTDLERAARFLYLQRLAFGGQVRGVFGVAPAHAPRFSIAKLEPILEAAHERLDGVVFENLPWQDVVRRYDTPRTLFYLDPPYWGCENDYGKDMFSEDQFAEMAAQLGQVKDSFLMSINDVPPIRALFGSFHLQEVKLKYSVSEGGHTAARELIVSNRPERTGLL